MNVSNATVARITLIACVVVGAVVGSVYALHRLSHIITLLVVALFIAIVLAPSVDVLVRRARFPRGLAVLAVFLAGLLAFAGLTFAFVRPIVKQSRQFVDDLPTFVADAKAGRGRVGELVKKYKLDDFVEKNQDKLKEARKELGKRAVPLASTVASSVAATVTTLVLAVLMLMSGPDIQAGMLDLIDDGILRERIRRLAHDASLAMTRYMAGNLIISVIAGAATYVALLVTGTPFKEVLALWVAFADLIPLVGATLGAVPTILVAFLHSTVAGIAVLVFFILYQQFENHVLQVTIMARSVRLNPLAVLVSVLVGVEIFGILGALLAIPVAGVIQVIVVDLINEHRRKRLAAVTVAPRD
ncbi:MAG TPA: AI-2E family transporter [Acidimicrobiales bacterium]|nr:AI-2E family transporter [Acidimicrobiales bacterium]